MVLVNKGEKRFLVRNQWNVNNKTLENSEIYIIDAKKKILDTLRIVKTYFVGKLYMNHIKNMNNVHEGFKDLLSAIINLGTNFSDGDAVFYDVVRHLDLS